MSAVASPAFRQPTTEREKNADDGRRICLVGSGSRFVSGISYYTHRLSGALAERDKVSVILIRQLLPAIFYPGRDRVGKAIARFDYPEDVRVFDGIDWWGRGLRPAIHFLRRERPDVLVLQWWSGTVLHSYLALAAAARRMGIKVVVEFHESLDTAELGIPLANAYVRQVSPRLWELSDAAIVHSKYDLEALRDSYSGGRRPMRIISHGPYDRYQQGQRPTRSGPFRLLYFGVIRPFKGVEDLIAAFDSMNDEEASKFELQVVGETWEGWTKPGEMIERSPHRDRIDFVNHYVHDDEVARIFGEADAVVLPYHRSSASGPLHIAMSQGLPVIVSGVGGLIEATSEYEGAIRVPPRDPDAIRSAMTQVLTWRGRTFSDPHSWDRTVDAYESLFDEITAATGVRAR